MSSTYFFLTGALTFGFLIIGLFFFRFWDKTRDRLFAIFGASFWVMAFERIVILAMSESRSNDEHAIVYVFRLSAFVMILIGIIDKNRSKTI